MIHGVRTFVPGLVEHGDAHVVITASIAGHVGGSFSGPYFVAKHGVTALAETLYHELRADGWLSDATRRRLARDAFAHTAAYDAAIVTWFDDPGSDLRLVEINGTFNAWAQLYAASDEVTNSLALWRCSARRS